ncbi:MAG TPA: hypothetical protein VLI39_01700 [Sedimentisphaerales bacterium]|nr:hypothetical protein [Sedimentisphaerales bacterium]
MGSFSNYWENKVLDHLFGKGTYAPPTIHVALSTADPGEDGSGLDEPEGAGYARAVTQASDWSSADGGLIDNVEGIEFNAATGAWGTLTHFALFDAATGGNLLAHGSLTQPRNVNASDAPVFPPSDLQVTLD